MAVYQLPEANALDVAHRVKEQMEVLSQRFPDDLDWAVLYDTTLFIEVSIAEVVETLIIALILVILVTFLFLQDWRATLIPSIAIPVSLVGTFAAMLVMGMSVNTISLFGLILAIGIVVDDAIVVIENVQRHMSDGMDAKEATRDRHGRGDRPDCRYHAGIAGRVRPGRIHAGHYGAALQPVRNHHLVCGGDFLDQCPYPEPGVVRHIAAILQPGGIRFFSVQVVQSDT